jgi:predicted amidohydrolase
VLVQTHPIAKTRRASEDIAALVLQQLADAKVETREISICGLQVDPPRPNESPIQLQERITRQILDIASREQVDLFVLPESCPVGNASDWKLDSQQWLVKIDQVFAELARHVSACICYGTLGYKMNEMGQAALCVEQVVVDANGNRVAISGKRENCAHKDDQETASAVSSSCFNIGPVKLGMLLSDDLSKPERAQALANQEQVDVIIHSSVCKQGALMEASKVFRQARAWENGVWVVSVNYAGEEHGESAVVPPVCSGVQSVQSLKYEEGCLMVRIPKQERD